MFNIRSVHLNLPTARHGRAPSLSLSVPGSRIGRFTSLLARRTPQEALEPPHSLVITLGIEKWLCSLRLGVIAKQWQDVDFRFVRVQRKDVVRNWARVQRHCIPENRGQAGQMLEIVVLQYLQLFHDLGREARAAFAPVDEEALKMQARIFAVTPEVGNPVDDAGILSCGGRGPQITRQHGQPLEGPVVQDVVVGVIGMRTACNRKSCRS